jgi:flagellar biosynthesis protein FlhF
MQQPRPEIALAMELRTYRAATMYEALTLVRRELGMDAAVLHTREVRGRGFLGLWPGRREIEVTASCGVNVPSRLASRGHADQAAAIDTAASLTASLPSSPATTADFSATDSVAPAHREAKLSQQMQGQLSTLQAMVKDLCRRSKCSDGGQDRDLPDGLFRLFTDLLDVDLSEEVARGLVERLRSEFHDSGFDDPPALKARLADMIEAEILVSGPMQVVPGRCRVAALVGPTGVGKTTTIAKLAANFRLKEKRRVGLITVDTYRIAAVEQLRTYADIIDLPMLVVSSPREMHEAVDRMSHLDLILMDTAGRSPRDEVRVQELRTFLEEASADEVHLVLSSVAATRTLQETAQRFTAIGATALILTKLDEATGLGSVLPVLRASGLPLSYLTNGQNVPDDIETAEPRRVATMILAGQV